MPAAETGTNESWMELTVSGAGTLTFNWRVDCEDDGSDTATWDHLEYSVDGEEILTGGTIPIVYFNQSDPEWADKPYGSDTIDRYGCGPTAMAMVVSSLCGELVDPAEMAALAAKQGYCAKGRGSYLSIVNGIARTYGLASEAIGALTVDAVSDALLTGDLLVALVGPGHFTSGGHFIVLRGVTLTGKLLVADPVSDERSLMEWDPQLILDELSASRNNGAPLWVISPPTER